MWCAWARCYSVSACNATLLPVQAIRWLYGHGLSEIHGGLKIAAAKHNRRSTHFLWGSYKITEQGEMQENKDALMVLQTLDMA